MILWAIASMTVLGVLFGVGLVLAAQAFRIQEDPRIDAVLEALPGLNCGSCGYAGCRSYAEAVVEGEKVDLCTAAGPDVTRMVAELMGVEVVEAVRLRAVVHCSGGTSQCGQRFEYVGENDCRAAHITAGGPKACAYGCLGLGTCATVCPFDAIVMSAEGLPVIDPEKCTACGICVRVCPRDLISLLAVDWKIYLGCSTGDRGKVVKDICSVGCIACGLCARKDPHEAIVMEDNLPVLDYEKAEGDFTTAAEVCPANCFAVEGELVAASVAAPGETQESA